MQWKAHDIYYKTVPLVISKVSIVIVVETTQNLPILENCQFNNFHPSSSPNNVNNSTLWQWYSTIPHQTLINIYQTSYLLDLYHCNALYHRLILRIVTIWLYPSWCALYISCYYGCHIMSMARSSINGYDVTIELLPQIYNYLLIDKYHFLQIINNSHCIVYYHH